MTFSNVLIIFVNLCKRTSGSAYIVTLGTGRLIFANIAKHESHAIILDSSKSTNFQQRCSLQKWSRIFSSK